MKLKLAFLAAVLAHTHRRDRVCPDDSSGACARRSGENCLGPTSAPFACSDANAIHHQARSRLRRLEAAACFVLWLCTEHSAIQRRGRTHHANSNYDRSYHHQHDPRLSFWIFHHHPGEQVGVGEQYRCGLLGIPDQHR